VLEGDIAASVTLIPVTYRAELNETSVTSPMTQLSRIAETPAQIGVVTEASPRPIAQ
jgi:hypothetical protein